MLSFLMVFTQVVFGGSEGALAGISGIAAMGLQIVGFGDDQIQLEGLPLAGNVRIGRKTTFDL